MREIAFIEQLEASPIQIDFVQVVIVGVFTFLPAIGGEIENPVLFIDSRDILAVPGSGSELFFEFAILIKKIEMRPPVSF